jgi:hypothetical protein
MHKPGRVQQMAISRAYVMSIWEEQLKGVKIPDESCNMVSGPEPKLVK